MKKRDKILVLKSRINVLQADLLLTRQRLTHEINLQRENENLRNVIVTKNVEIAELKRDVGAAEHAFDRERERNKELREWLAAAEEQVRDLKNVTLREIKRQLADEDRIV